MTSVMGRLWLRKLRVRGPTPGDIRERSHVVVCGAGGRLFLYPRFTKLAGTSIQCSGRRTSATIVAVASAVTDVRATSSPM